MTSPSSDRNFLFALVAYQNGYIKIEQFFEAAQIWNKDPKKDIGDILVERKFIDDVERFNIQGIVEDRLRRQGGIDNSLSYVVENGSVPQGEDLPEAWQEKFSQITKVSDDSVKSPVSKPTPGPSIHRYLFRRPIGEGGQGIVWEVDDTELGRRIALKKVHPKHANSPLHKGMLIEESRNTGRLDHAGIVPVYDLGHDDEGNPFFTMQLIKGEKLVDRVKAIKHETLSRQEYLAQIRPLLRHLIAACNTLQYAYDQFKVIHRDLKPENIMVNRYGETVVMDWGMGKAVEDMTQLDEASSMLFVPVSGSGSGVERTQVGSVKGTLGYLSPEQAQALNSNLDHRTDIYGLGATLYRILTGTVPFSGTSVEEALNRARLNQFVRPRERNWKIPKELEAICLKAMATLPSDRYQKATDMGMDLENWIAGEPISVVPDTLLKKSERWLRRHARGVIASLLLLGLTAAALLWATVAILGEKTKVDNLNNNLIAEQKKTKESRDVSSFVFDEVVGYIFDDALFGVPDSYEVRKRTLQLAVNKLGDPETGYVAKYPEDWNLKLDLLRLLTRLANLEKEIEPEEALSNWQKAEKLVRDASEVNDSKLERTNWLLAEADQKLYFADFYIQTKDYELAQKVNSSVDGLINRYEEIHGKTDDIQLLISRAMLQNALILECRGDLDEALKKTEQTVGTIERWIGEILTAEDFTKLSDGFDELFYQDVLVYLMARSQSSSLLAKLDKKTEFEKSLLKSLTICEKLVEVPNARRDTIEIAFGCLESLLLESIEQNKFSDTIRFYQSAQAWFERGKEFKEFQIRMVEFSMVVAENVQTFDSDVAKRAMSNTAELLKSFVEETEEVNRLRQRHAQLVGQLSKTLELEK
jgi:serine/threonine protein kinase